MNSRANKVPGTVSGLLVHQFADTAVDSFGINSFVLLLSSFYRLFEDRLNCAEICQVSGSFLFGKNPLYIKLLSLAFFLAVTKETGTNSASLQVAAGNKMPQDTI